MRVSTARMPGSALIWSASFFAIASETFFSRVPALPIAPGSSPPWPASIAITEVALPVAARNLDRHGRRRRQLVAEVHDEAIAIGLVRRRQESLGLDLLVDVEDDAQPMPAALADAHGLHDARGRGNSSDLRSASIASKSMTMRSGPESVKSE